MNRKSMRALAIAALVAVMVSPTIAFASGQAEAKQGEPRIDNSISDKEDPIFLHGMKKDPSFYQKRAVRTRVAVEPASASEPRGAVYKVASRMQFEEAIATISAASEQQATVVILADDATRGMKPFAGVPGKQVMLSSETGSQFGVTLASELVGSVTLDNIYASIEGGVLYACGNTFETTPGFTSSIRSIFGGGPAGKDVAGDTEVIIRGGRIDHLFGGGLDSNVGGSVHVLVDVPYTPSTSAPYTVNILFGGGLASKTDAGRVAGDVKVDFRCGGNGEFFGGGRNEFDPASNDEARMAASVGGTVTVNLGYKGAPERSVWTGAAVFTYAGSQFSTVGNVRLGIYDGCTGLNGAGDRNFYACGLHDTVLGTVEVVVDGFDLGGSYVSCGGERQASNDDPNACVRILNRDGKKNAVTVTWNTPMKNLDGEVWGGIHAGSNGEIHTVINGGVDVEVNSGYLAFIKLDNQFVQDPGVSTSGPCSIAGDSVLRITGDSKVAEIVGNEPEYGSPSSKRSTRLEISGAKADLGYLYMFDEVKATGGADVIVDSAVFPMFGGSIQKPFYSIDRLLVDGGATFVTRDSSTTVKKSIELDSGSWTSKGVVYDNGVLSMRNGATWHANKFSWIYGNAETSDSNLFMDTYFQVGYNYRGDAGIEENIAWKSKGDRVVTGANAYLNAVHGSVDVQGGIWDLLNPLSVKGNFTTEGLELRFPVVSDGKNYPNVWIPLEVQGLSSGNAKVNTLSCDGISDPMDASTWKGRVVVPRVYDNYITSWAPGGVSVDNHAGLPAQATFLLGDESAGAEGLYLKRVPDADPAYSDSIYMWQVADGYAVTFDKNNADEGSTEATPSRKVIDANPGEKAVVGELPVEPMRPGYDFDGWYTNPEGSGQRIDSKTVVSGDVTFYARWKKSTPLTPLTPSMPVNHTVTFVDGLPETVDRVLSVSHGESVCEQGAPVRDGWSFTGWYTTESCDKLYAFSDPVLSDITLYAGWERVESAKPSDPKDSGAMLPRAGDAAFFGMVALTGLGILGVASGMAARRKSR